MKTKTAKLTAIAAAAAIAVAAFATAQGWAHGPGGATAPNASQGMGMMQGGQGHGMGHGMMLGGQGMGHEQMATAAVGENCFGATASGLDLTTDKVTKMLEQRLTMHGNDRLKVGKVVQTDDDTIVAEIVTVDGSLVNKFAIDRDTGVHRPTK